MLSARTLINLSKYVESVILKSSDKDEYGYVFIEDVVEEINKHPLWEHIVPMDIIEVSKGSPLRRLEIIGNKIRLIAITSNKPAIFDHKVIPPKLLYYGTNIVGISRIKTFGIKSFREQYIKLFPDKKMVQVLIHKNSHIAYVEIEAFQAHLDGIEFIRGGVNTYLATFIPAKYIKKIS